MDNDKPSDEKPQGEEPHKEKSVGEADGQKKLRKGCIGRLFSFFLWEGMRLVIYGALAIAGFLAYQYYQPIIAERLQAHDPSEDVTAFSADWNIRGPFDAWSTASELAELCEIAYDQPDVATGKFNAKKFSDVQFFNADGLAKQPVYAVTGKRDKKNILVIVYRGSNDSSDWLQNINCYSRGTEIDGIHQGFSMSFAANRESIRDMAKSESVDEIWITGHSLGGALAVICGEYLSREPEVVEKIVGVFTFAQPMVAKNAYEKTLAEQLDEKLVHFVNAGDVVPRLALGYSHTGLMIHLREDEVLLSDRYFENPEFPDPYAKLYKKTTSLEPLNAEQFANVQLAAQEFSDGSQPFSFAKMWALQSEIDYAKISEEIPVPGGYRPFFTNAILNNTDWNEQFGTLVQGDPGELKEVYMRQMNAMGEAAFTRAQRVETGYHECAALHVGKAQTASEKFSSLLWVKTDHKISEYSAKIGSVIEKIDQLKTDDKEGDE